MENLVKSQSKHCFELSNERTDCNFLSFFHISCLSENLITEFFKAERGGTVENGRRLVKSGRCIKHDQTNFERKIKGQKRPMLMEGL